MNSTETSRKEKTLEELQRNNNSYTLEELLALLEESLENSTIPDRDLSQREAIIITQLGKKGLLTIIEICSLMLNEIAETGIIKRWMKKELLEVLPWEKTALGEKLQQMVRERILLLEKRRYYLNLEHPLVKRIQESLYLCQEELDFTACLKAFKQEKKGSDLLEKDKTKGIASEDVSQFRYVTKEEYTALIEGLYDVIYQRELFTTDQEVFETLQQYLQEKLLLITGFKEITD